MYLTSCHHLCIVPTARTQFNVIILYYKYTVRSLTLELITYTSSLTSVIISDKHYTKQVCVIVVVEY